MCDHHPGRNRVEEFGLKRMYCSPNGTIRNILGGAAIFRKPIICRNVPRLVPGWTQPGWSDGTLTATKYRATDFLFPGPGKLTIKFEGADGQAIEREVFAAPSSGVTVAMYNLNTSIYDFARLSFNYGLNMGWPVYLSPRTRSSKPMTITSKTSSPKSTRPN